MGTRLCDRIERADAALHALSLDELLQDLPGDEPDIDLDEPSFDDGSLDWGTMTS